MTEIGGMDVDLFLGPTCCRVVSELVPEDDPLKYIGTTIKEVQKGKYVQRAKKTSRGVRRRDARPK